MILTAVEPIKALAVVHLDAFGFVQLLQAYTAEIPYRQEEQADEVTSGSYASAVDLCKT